MNRTRTILSVASLLIAIKLYSVLLKLWENNQALPKEKNKNMICMWNSVLRE